MTATTPAPEPIVQPRRIVVGVDGSPSSLDALRWAARLAPLTGARIEAVIAWQYPVPIGWAMPDWDPEAEARKVLIASVDEAYGAECPDGMALVVREGNPAKVLIEAAAGATMLVVGNRGRGGFAGLRLGSVSAHCAEHATCPVLVIHGDSTA
jgi:nucleotide-binding universal stress UspA family protein